MNVNDKEEGKISCLIGQVTSVTKELKDKILPELKTKLKPILYSPSEECEGMPKEPTREGSRLFTSLEEHRRDLVDISNMILDIYNQMDL